MKKLNLRNPKTFDYTKEAGAIPPRIRFYCVSEGATEESYFFGVRNNRKELHIKNDVYIEVVEKQDIKPSHAVGACLFTANGTY